jgi:hypothetical protein
MALEGKSSMSLLRRLIVAGAALAAIPSGAMAQAMTPMRGEVKSFADSFALRVYPANPYPHRIRIEVKVYDQDFREISGAQVTPRVFTLGGKSSRQVLVMIPFAGQRERKVRICTESVPFPGQTSRIRTQICGKYLGQRL